jgi:hypothetical protein
LVELLGLYSNLTYVRSKLREILDVPPAVRPERTVSKQLQVHLSKEDQLEVVEAYLRTRSVYVVAREFGIGRQTAAAILERHGVKPASRYGRSGRTNGGRIFVFIVFFYLKTHE